jgi:hypothetical protein
MSLADLRDGDRVFIDANIFIYHFGGRSLDGADVLKRAAHAWRSAANTHRGQTSWWGDRVIQ